MGGGGGVKKGGDGRQRDRHTTAAEPEGRCNGHTNKPPQVPGTGHNLFP